MEYKELQRKHLQEDVEVLEGAPAYLFNSDRFVKNYTDLQNEFRKIYPNTRIAYSYKTNFVTEIGKLVNMLGGYAEVVSPMETEIAKKAVSCPSPRIIYNGLLPDRCVVSILEHGGKVNVESQECLNYVLNNVKCQVGIGLRIGEPESRFGFQESELFDVLAQIIASGKKVSGIHCHVGGSRSLKTWKKKAERMVRITKDIEKIVDYPLEYIDLGGHLYGRMDKQLKKQFDNVPSFKDYAETVATVIRDAYKDKISMPQLILEPGTALVADAVSILATVQNVKYRKGKSVATLDVSSHDCGMVADYKDLTIENISGDNLHDDNSSTVVCGYTCMEEDYINRCYPGTLRTGDHVLVRNCGAYSISMKGNFIYPPLGMYMVNDNYEITRLMKMPGEVGDVICKML